MKMTEREMVYNKFDGNCAYCGCDIRINKKADGDAKVMQVDHFEPIYRGAYKK